LKIRTLEWDSNFWGFRIGHCDQIGELDGSERDFKVVQACIQVNYTGSIHQLETYGFTYIDLRMEYELDLLSLNDRNKIQNIMHIGQVLSGKEIEEIASIFVPHSRFNHSPFSHHSVGNFYAEWIRNAIKGTYDTYFRVMNKDNATAGIISGRMVEGNTFCIGLLGVLPEYQGHGIGSDLIRALISDLYNQDIQKVRVVTEGKNLNAQRFYCRLGFLIEDIKIWMYMLPK
jgi:ribosomal protein S18 acetylase RimI-like enzyme